MASTPHDTSCSCADCRARRAATWLLESSRYEDSPPDEVEESEVEESAEDRRRHGARSILMGVGISLFSLLAVEGTMWLLFGKFGSYGIIDAIFVLLGLYYIIRGVYEVATSKTKPEGRGS